MHRTIKWAPLYHGLQKLAIETIIIPTKLPKKPKKGTMAADPYYREMCGNLRSAVLGLVETAEDLASDTDSFFNSDVEYTFNHDDIDSVYDFESALEEAVSQYQDSIKEYMGNSWNFGPGDCPWPEGFELRYRPVKAAEIKRLMATQKEYIKVLKKKEADYMKERKGAMRARFARRKKK